MLVEPGADRLAALVDANRAHLAQFEGLIGGMSFGDARRELRRRMGFGDDPLIVTGHQPDFIHAGVWAKHVVAMRLAEAVGGRAVNLIVDHDAPKSFSFAAPQVEGAVVRRMHLRYADWASGAAMEGIPVATPQSVCTLRQELSGALGELYERSQMPLFLGEYETAKRCDDWVEQSVRGRRAVENAFGVRVEDRRVSRWWYGPLLCALLGDAERFAREYNQALASYRRANGIVGNQRPIPDLHWENRDCETALWAYRIGEPRQRLFVRRNGERVTLTAGDAQLLECSANEASRWEKLGPLLASIDGWRIRPRALTLTLWARLVLGDLFIHGIGGAKYDRITDMLIRGYFGVDAPAMACVSATLRLPLGCTKVTQADVRRAERDQRDVRFNPERHTREAAVPREFTTLTAQKRELIAESLRLQRDEPRNRRQRRQVFDEIRETNQAMLASAPEVAEQVAERLQRLSGALASRDAARDREYFFALHPRENFALLLDNLPGVTDPRQTSIVDTSKQ